MKLSETSKLVLCSDLVSREKAGYILAMSLLQSGLDLNDEEMAACAEFTQPEVIRRVLKEIK